MEGTEREVSMVARSKEGVAVGAARATGARENEEESGDAIRGHPPCFPVVMGKYGDDVDR
jgi:hypothetical protein